MPVLPKILGDPINRELKRHRGAVDRTNALEPEMQALSDAELRAKTDEFRARLGVTGPDLTFGQTYSQGLSSDVEEDAEAEYARKEAAERAVERRRGLDELLPEAFAVVREAAVRTLGMRHYDVQLIGGIVLHQGKIAEMRTGEGKTLVATLALYLNALEGRGTHLVTVNDYLARRDAGWNAPLYTALGMTVAATLRRKRKITITTSPVVSSSSNSTSFTDARIVVVRSLMTRTPIPSGSDASICGSSAWTASTTWMMFVPGWR